MSGFSSQGSRPYLKPDCGMVLQRAWNDGLWSSAITMAKQKSKATKDPYYEVSSYAMSLQCSLEVLVHERTRSARRKPGLGFEGLIPGNELAEP